MTFLRAALLHINDILRGADYKAGVLSHVLQISARLKQNAETCIKATSGFKHEERAGPCDDAEDGFTPSLNSIVCSVFHRILPV